MAVTSRSKVVSRSKVKGRGQGQRSESRSNFWLAAVDNRGSALPSAAKSNKSQYQFKMFVCASVISGRMRIIAHMRSIGVLITCSFGSTRLFRFLEIALRSSFASCVFHISNLCRCFSGRFRNPSNRPVALFPLTLITTRFLTSPALKAKLRYCITHVRAIPFEILRCAEFKISMTPSHIFTFDRTHAYSWNPLNPHIIFSVNLIPTNFFQVFIPPSGSHDLKGAQFFSSWPKGGGTRIFFSAQGRGRGNQNFLHI